MASLKRIWTMSLACGALLLCGQAAAQIAPGPGDNGPTDITGDSADRYEDKHLTVYHGDVEVVQNGARLLCDTLYIYSYGPGEGPNAQKAAKPAPAKPAAGGAAEDNTTGSIKQLVAEGHVFYVTQNETVRGDRGVYDAEPDTITLTGGVVAVQGKNVVRGDKMIMDRKTGHTTMISNVSGRNKPGRVRGVFYNDNQNSQGQNAPGGQGQNAPAPAKKP